MPNLIKELLLGGPFGNKGLYSANELKKGKTDLQKIGEKELYNALLKKGHKNRQKNGGLGHYFAKKTRHSLVTDALDIDDKAKTVKIKSDVELYKLALAFGSGDPKRNIEKNINKSAICLALICRQLNYIRPGNRAPDFTHARRALGNLSIIYSLVDGLVDNEILKIITDKKAALEAFFKHNVIHENHIKQISKDYHKNSTHKVAMVQVGDNAYIEKKEVKKEISSLEAFSGTMMQLFIGPHQPTTRRVTIERVSNHVPLLSERIPGFIQFYDAERKHPHEGLEMWAEAGFPCAAEMDVASVFMEETDYHSGNGGIAFFKPAGVDAEPVLLAARIDFDNAIASIGHPFISQRLKSKKYCLNGVIHKLHGLNSVDALEINEDDLELLPQLSIANLENFRPKGKYFDPYKLFIPYNWWTHSIQSRSVELKPALAKKIDELAKNPRYLSGKFTAMLEKIILPSKLVKLIADNTIFDRHLIEPIMEWFEKRQQKMRKVAEKVPGFRDFMRDQGKAALSELKERFRVFFERRPDLFHDRKKPDYFYSLYNENFYGYLNELGLKNEVQQDIKENKAESGAEVKKSNGSAMERNLPDADPLPNNLLLPAKAQVESVDAAPDAICFLSDAVDAAPPEIKSDKESVVAPLLESIDLGPDAVSAEHKHHHSHHRNGACEMPHVSGSTETPDLLTRSSSAVLLTKLSLKKGDGNSQQADLETKTSQQKVKETQPYTDEVAKQLYELLDSENYDDFNKLFMKLSPDDRKKAVVKRYELETDDGKAIFTLAHLAADTKNLKIFRQLVNHEPRVLLMLDQDQKTPLYMLQNAFTLSFFEGGAFRFQYVATMSKGLEIFDALRNGRSLNDQNLFEPIELLTDYPCSTILSQPNVPQADVSSSYFLPRI